MRASRGRVLEAPARWAGQPFLEYDAPAKDGYSGGLVMDAQGRVLPTDTLQCVRAPAAPQAGGAATSPGDP